MAQYDEIVKHLMHRYAYEFAMLSFGTPDVQVLETLDSEKTYIGGNDARISIYRTP